ncbi:unnamed protein product [Sphagnum tenellum]
MSLTFEDVVVSELSVDSFQFRPKFANPIRLQAIDESDNILIRCKHQFSETNSLCDIEIFKDSETALFGDNGFVVTDSGKTTLFVFNRTKQQRNERNGSEIDLNVFHKFINDYKVGRKESVFSERTDESSASQYFQFYGYLSQQQNMMQDYIRTSTYQRAILANIDDFKDKVVLDVGAGSGILSFFAAQAGARKVYAVEASSMAKHAETLVFNNKLNDRIQVIPGKIEEITLPEQLTKANFWFQQNFHGVDLSSLRGAALKEYFYQPVVDTFDIRICTAKSYRYSVDFTKAHEKDLHRLDIPISFVMHQTDEVHGLAFWFDVAFFGSQQAVRCLIDTPLFVQRGQTLTGRVVLTSNKRQSYNVDIELCVESPGRTERATNSLDLKNPYFRYTGQPPQPPPGCNDTSPSEQYWQTLDSSQSTNNVMNGMVVMNGTNAQPITPSVIDINNMQIQSNNSLSQNHLQSPMSANAVIHPTHNTQMINLGSLPSPNATSRTSPHTRIQTVAAQVPTSSIGGGISPSLFTNTPQQVSVLNSANFPVNNSLMIGDYAVAPQNLILPTHSIFYPSMK